MNHTFGYTFMVECVIFSRKKEVFKQHRSRCVAFSEFWSSASGDLGYS